jgi:hypothetical protein
MANSILVLAAAAAVAQAQQFSITSFSNAACTTQTNFIAMRMTGSCFLLAGNTYAKTSYVTATNKETAELYATTDCTGTPIQTYIATLDNVCTVNPTNSAEWYKATALAVPSGASSTAVSAAAALVLAVAAAAGLRA